MSNNVADGKTAVQRQTNKILTRIEKANSRLVAQLEGQAKQLEEGLSSVQEQIKEQTNALGEMEIINRLAEMESILELIKIEEEYASKENLEDSGDLRELKQHFDDRATEVGNRRNSQVTDLIAPIVQARDQELIGTLERRINQVIPVLRDCFEVTEGTIRQREEVMRATISASQTAVEAFVRQRREVRSAIAGFQLDPEKLPSEGQEATAVAIPYYLVEIEDANGQTSTELVPPSVVDDDADVVGGLDLLAIQGLETVTNSLTSRINELKSLFRGKGRTTEESMSMVMPDVTAGGALRKMAAGSMREHLQSRSVSFRREGPSEHALGLAFQRQQDSDAPLAESSSRPPVPKPERPAAASEPGPQRQIMNDAGGAGIRTATGAKNQGLVHGAKQGASAGRNDFPAPPREGPGSLESPADQRNGDKLDAEDADEILKVAMSLIKRREFHKAIAILEDLKAEGCDNPMVTLYAQLCREELEKRSGGSGD